MDSFTRTSGFCYQSSPEAMTDVEGDGFSGILDIYVHHARNIHNICIYDNQDVYAKFSLTCSPDEAFSTRIINGGGKNPDFNENLSIKITQPDSVLKCEIWMFSRARNYMEDQLLGFALVPLSSVGAKGKMTQDFTLSSTDLFDSPAGTVKLTLLLTSSMSANPSETTFSDSVKSSISSEVVLLNRKNSEVWDPVEYGRIEFPDINVATENQQMVSEYFDMAKHNSASRTSLVGPASFLHLGASSQPMDDYDMTLNSSEDNYDGSVSPNESIHASGVFCSTTTSISDDRNSIDSVEKKNRATGDFSNSQVVSSSAEVHSNSEASPDTPTSRKGSTSRENKESHSLTKEESAKESNMGSVKLDPVFKAPLGNINLDAEESGMQQQIVDMYTRSMQQFTESLAKMKLPMDLDKPESDNGGDVIQQHSNKLEQEKKKKDGTRVFYGSRAFF